MSSSLWTFYMVFYYLDCALALSLNICIVLANLKSLKNSMIQNPCGRIQFIMGVVNITMRILLAMQFTALVFPTTRFEVLTYIVLILLPFQMSFSDWLVAWLCAYYCFHITNYKHHLFIWAKQNLPSLLPYLLGLPAIGMMSLTVTSFFAVGSSQLYYNENGTVLSMGHDGMTTLNVISSCLGFCLPSGISLLFLLATIMSLVRHVWNMQQRDSAFTQPQIHAHVNGIRTMILLLLLTVFFHVSGAIVFSKMFSSESLEYIISWIVIILFPTMEAFIIVQSSSKLRQRIMGSFCPGRLVEASS